MAKSIIRDSCNASVIFCLARSRCSFLSQEYKALHLHFGTEAITIMPTDHHEKPCLAIEFEDRSNIFALRLMDVNLKTDWAAMLLKPKIHVIGNVPSRLVEEVAMLRFAIALKSHDCLQAIHFTDIHVEDLSHIWWRWQVPFQNHVVKDNSR
jgi:hypothetical protein